MAGLVLWNRELGRPEFVEGDQVQAALASGKYAEGNPEVTQGEAAPVIRGADTIGAAEAHGEHATAAVAAKSAAAREQQRREYVDTPGDKALTFAEGVVDALSFGLVHEPGATADLRRDVNSGYALAGELTGMVIGMETGVGPMRVVSSFGKKAGVRAAEMVLGDIAPGSRAAIAARALEGGGEMAALMGAGSVGHQVTDAVLDDKDFSAAAVVHEAGVGAIMGGTFSFLHGVFGRAASRYDIGAQGGLLDPTSDAAKGLLDHVDGVQQAWREALDAHETRLGVLKALQADGVLDNAVPEFLAQREIALAEARGALADLGEMSFDDALNGDTKAWGRWHAAMERAQSKLDALDGLMQPRQLERMRPTEPGQPITDPGAPKTGQLGIPMEDVATMDRLMRDPERAAEYERLHGRPYEPQAQYDAEGAENLGGKTSPTSELATPARSPRAIIPEVAEAQTPSLTDKFDLSDSPMEGPTRTPSPFAETPAVSIEAPSKPWAPSSPGGKFNLAEWTPARVIGEMGEGTTVGKTEAAAVRDNTLAHDSVTKDQHLFPDGYWAPAAQVADNAEAFARFRERMSVDTPMTQMPGINTGDSTGSKPVVSKTPVKNPWGGPFVEPTPVVGLEERAPSSSKVPTPAAAPTPARTPSPVKPMHGPKTKGEALAASAKEEGRAAVRRYLDEWYATAEQVGPKFSPGEVAAQKIRGHVDELRSTLAGREVAAQAAGAKLNLPIARTALGAELNGIYAMRQVAGLAADASKGLAAASGSQSRFLNWVKRRAGGKIGAALLGGALGHTVGGPLGYYVGAAAAFKYVGFSGRAAGAAGRLYVASLKAAEKLLSGNRAAYSARALMGTRTSTANPFKPQPIAYSERGSIADPIERIADLKRVAGSPATIAHMVVRASGDLNVVSPEFVASTVATVTQQLTWLASVAPDIQYDRLNRPIQPSAGAIRRFVEAEAAIADLPSVLDAVARGSVTKMQAEALRNGHTAVHARIAAFLLKDPEALAQVERAKLHTIEMVTGVPLSPGADPAFVLRQQSSFQPEQLPGQTPGPAQALKIPGAGRAPSDLPTAKPLPSDTFSGRAPGN